MIEVPAKEGEVHTFSTPDGDRVSVFIKDGTIHVGIRHNNGGVIVADCITKYAQDVDWRKVTSLPSPLPS